MRLVCSWGTVRKGPKYTLYSARAPEDIKEYLLGPPPTRSANKECTWPFSRWYSRLSLQLGQWTFCHLPCYPPCRVQPHRWYIRRRLFLAKPSSSSHLFPFHHLMGPPPPLLLHRAPLFSLTDKLLSSRWATRDRRIPFTTTLSRPPFHDHPNRTSFRVSIQRVTLMVPSSTPRACAEPVPLALQT